MFSNSLVNAVGDEAVTFFLLRRHEMRETAGGRDHGGLSHNLAQDDECET